MKVHAPVSEQPNICRSYEELAECERPMYDACKQEKYVEDLIKYLSLENQKRRDKFKTKHMILFKVRMLDLTDS